MTGPEGRELEDGRKDEQRDCEKDKTARLSRAKLFLVCSRREPPAKEWSHTGFLMSSKLFSLGSFYNTKTHALRPVGECRRGRGQVSARKAGQTDRIAVNHGRSCIYRVCMPASALNPAWTRIFCRNIRSGETFLRVQGFRARGQRGQQLQAPTAQQPLSLQCPAILLLLVSLAAPHAGPDPNRHFCTSNYEQSTPSPLELGLVGDNTRHTCHARKKQTSSNISTEEIDLLLDD